MTGEVDLAVLAGDTTRRIDQDRGVETPLPIALADDLGVAEVEAQPELPSELEQRRGRRARHLVLVERIELRLVSHPPAGEEGGERKLGEHDEPRAPSVRLAHHLLHACNGRSARLVAGDRTHLGGGNANFPAHGSRLPAPRGAAVEGGARCRKLHSGPIMPVVHRLRRVWKPNRCGLRVRAGATSAYTARTGPGRGRSGVVTAYPSASVIADKGYGFPISRESIGLHMAAEGQNGQ